MTEDVFSNTVAEHYVVEPRDRSGWTGPLLKLVEQRTGKNQNTTICKVRGIQYLKGLFKIEKEESRRENQKEVEKEKIPVLNTVLILAGLLLLYVMLNKTVVQTNTRLQPTLHSIQIYKIKNW